MGGHAGAQTGVAAQTSGTVFVYGWKILFYNKILDVNGVIQMPAAISTTSASLTGALSAASASSTGGLTCSSLTLNSVVFPTPSYILVQNTLASV